MNEVLLSRFNAYLSCRILGRKVVSYNTYLRQHCVTVCNCKLTSLRGL